MTQVIEVKPTDIIGWQKNLPEKSIYRHLPLEDCVLEYVYQLHAGSLDNIWLEKRFLHHKNLWEVMGQYGAMLAILK